MSSFHHHRSFPSSRDDASSIKKSDLVKNSSCELSSHQQRKPFQRLSANQQQPSEKAHFHYKPKSIVSETTTVSDMESRGPVMASRNESEFQQQEQQYESEVEYSVLSENRTQPDSEDSMEHVFRSRSWLQEDIPSQDDHDDLRSMWTLKRANPITELSDSETEDNVDELATAYASPTKRSRRTQLDWEHWLGDDGELLS